MAEPAGERLVECRLQRAADEQEGRCARSAVQVLVAAADREIDAGAVDVERHRAGAVRQVPQHQGPRLVGGGGDRRHVVHPGRAVVDVGQREHRDVLVERRHQQIGVDAAQGVALIQQVDQPLHDVHVGREVLSLGQDHLAPGAQPERRGEQLEQIDRGAVGDHHLAGVGADQGRDLVADAARRIDPAGVVPALDQAGAPVTFEHLGDPFRHGHRQGPERVAVEIDHVRRQAERPAEVGQRVVQIELLAGLPVQRGHRAILRSALGANLAKRGAGCKGGVAFG